MECYHKQVAIKRQLISYSCRNSETALSPRSQLELLEILGTNSRAGHAQFIIATHSPILLACAGAKIYSFDHVPVCPVAYEETEHYQIYKNFLMDRNKYLQLDSIGIFFWDTD